jgi:UDP-N-acetylglucosamine 2-epimerase (non-hydrolysing)
MPEEHNRVLIDHLADLCCAPTPVSALNLQAEGVPESRIVITGNTIVEAVCRLLPPLSARQRLLADYGLSPCEFVLATVHRPENTTAATLEQILTALAELSLPVIFPIHPRTAAAIESGGLDQLLESLRTVPPLPYEQFLGLIAECAVCVSDSGGVQEEVSILGRPVVVVRRSTERPEVQGTWATLVSPDSVVKTVEALVADLPALHSRLALRVTPYGDGSASIRTVEALTQLLPRQPYGLT